MNHSDFEPYELNRRLYLLIGLWPYEDSSTRCWRAYIVTVFFSAAIIVQTYMLLTLEVQVQPITELMMTYLPTICFSICYYHVLYNPEKVITLQERINADFNNLVNEQEWVVMKKYVHQNKKYSLMIAGAIYLYLVILLLPCFQSIYLNTFYNATELTLPIHMEYFIQNKTYYFGMLSLQVVTISILCTVGMAYYGMAMAYLQHACALFTIVTIKIDNLFKEKVCDFHFKSSITKQEKESDRMVSVIKYYSRAIDYIDLILSISSKIYFIQLILGLIFLIIDFLQLFRLLDMAIMKTEVIKNIIYINGTFIIIYIGFYMGQRIIDHNVKVYEQCCQIPFYALSIKAQKLLVMLTIRSLKPCSINVNGMFVMSHEGFGKLTNMSYSFAIMCYKIR